VVVTQTGTASGTITPSDLRCADGWAGWIGRPDDQFGDGYFAVARWNGSSWQLVNLGTALVCEAAGVPVGTWSAIGCFE
jgi:hypothetical protein